MVTKSHLASGEPLFNVPPESNDSPSWFHVHLLPHEGMLRKWLRGLFPRGCEIDDIVQESYVRVLRAHQTREISSPKAFLFSTARHLAIDTFRQKHHQPTNSLAVIDSDSVLDESRGTPESIIYTEESKLLHAAIESLPRRCREIFILRKIHGLSQREIAARLGISLNSVSAQMTIGLRKCMVHLAKERREAGDRHG